MARTWLKMFIILAVFAAVSSLGILTVRGLRAAPGLYPGTATRVRLVELPSLDIRIKVADPVWIAERTSPQVAELVARAQDANASWLSLWAIKDRYKLSYHRIGFALWFSKSNYDEPEAPPYIGLDRRETVNYKGSFNRGIGFTDIAEFIILGGLLGETGELRVSESVFEKQPVYDLAGEIRGDIVSRLASRMFVHFMETDMSELQLWKDTWKPKDHGDPKKITFRLSFRKEDARLVRSQYSTLDSNDSVVAKWDIRYLQASWTYDPGYPQVVRVAEYLSAPASGAGPRLWTYQFQFTRVNGLWMLSEGTLVRHNDPDRPAGVMMVIDAPQVEESGLRPNDDWIDMLAG